MAEGRPPVSAPADRPDAARRTDERPEPAGRADERPVVPDVTAEERPALPDVTTDERGVGWGDPYEQDDDERYLREVPPHHGT